MNDRTTNNPRTCPNCQFEKSKVTETRIKPPNDILVRTRLCPKCRFQWHTLECIMGEKTDGRRNN